MVTVLTVAYPFAPVGPDAVGGAEQVTSAVEAAIVAAGHRSLLLACEGSVAAGELVGHPRLEGPLTPERMAAERIRQRERIAAVIARERVDLVHCHGVDFWRYLPAEGTPLLATLHMPPDYYPAAAFAPERAGTYLNCVSETQRRACPPSPAIVGVVTNGVDLARFRPAPRRSGPALVLSRVCPEKGIHLALEAARLAGLPLVVAGEVFPYPEHVRYFEEEVRPRLDGDRRFVGPLGGEEKLALLSEARCLVIPSRVAETSSLVAMEALASGTPVVAFPVGTLPEVVAHGHTGVLVSTVEEMAAAMRDAADLPSEPCRAAAEARFSREGMCRAYLDLHARLLPPARGTGPRGELIADPIGALSDLEALASEWGSLWQRCPEATVFQRPEWLLPWCRHLLAGEVDAVALRRGARLVGLAPFFRWEDRGVPVVSLMGAGVSDYANILVEPGEREAAAVAVRRWLEGRRYSFSEVPSGSLLLDVHRDLGGTPAIQDVCPGILLDQQPLERCLRPRAWANACYARRRACRDLGMFINETTGEMLAPLLDRLAALHAGRFPTTPLAHEPTRAFLHDASARLRTCGALALYGLWLNDELAGVLYGLRDRRALRYWLSAFDPAFAWASPGTLLVAHALERAHQSGAALFDFLRGPEPYKYAWGARDVTSIHSCEPLAVSCEL